jgi:hypothetical protein
VVTNADGSRRVSVDAQLAARVSGVWWIVTALLVLGGLSLAGGGALVDSGARPAGAGRRGAYAKRISPCPKSEVDPNIQRAASVDHGYAPPAVLPG